MANEYYNRYQKYLIGEQQTIVPYVKLPIKGSDKKYIYKLGVSRLDKISQLYYESPYFGWLILQANPQYGGSELNIPDNAVLTVPFPLNSSLLDYNSAVDTYFYYYGR
jgi:hypothetical protein